MFLAPIVLLGWPILAITVAVRLRNVNLVTRIAVGVMTCIILIASFFIFPAGAVTWSLGFAANFRLTKHPAQIQQWAIQVLDRYDAGKLSLTTNVEYWAVGKAKLKDSEIPSQIKDLWWKRPSIGVATITDNGWFTESMPTNIAIMPQLTGGQPTPLHLSHCVAFSWYETGFLVGRQDFKSKWNPWYLHEITPGVYVFCGMK